LSVILLMMADIKSKHEEVSVSLLPDHSLVDLVLFK
jgi:hypothetical protein